MDSVNPTTSDLLVEGNEFDAVNPSLNDSRNNGVDFDSLLGEESQGGDLDMNDSDLVNLLKHERTDGSESGVMNDSEGSLNSIDNLVRMPILEVEGPDESMTSDMRMMNQNMTNQGINPMNLMGNINNQRAMMAQMQQMQQMQQMHQIQQQSPLNSPLNSPHNNRNIQPMLNGMAYQQARQGMFQSQPQSEMDRLQQEKINLLNKLSELNMRHKQLHATPIMAQANMSRQINMNQQMIQQMNHMRQMQENILRQQMQQQQSLEQGRQQNSQKQKNNALPPMGGMPVRPMVVGGGNGSVPPPMPPKPTLVNAVASMSVKDKGAKASESPLTSFLRKGKMGTQGENLQKASSPPDSASVFSKKPGTAYSFKPTTATNTDKQLVGGMDRSTLSQNMVKQMNFMTNGPSRNGGNTRLGSNPAKQQKGYRYSGILPKHASDGNLLRSSSPGLAKTAGKVTSISKDNMILGLARSKGRAVDISHSGLIKRSSSKNLNEKGGEVYAKKRVGSAKYKFGTAGSVPGQLNIQKGGGDSSTGDGDQGNARW